MKNKINELQTRLELYDAISNKGKGEDNLVLSIMILEGTKNDFNEKLEEIYNTMKKLMDINNYSYKNLYTKCWNIVNILKEEIESEIEKITELLNYDILKV